MLHKIEFTPEQLQQMVEMHDSGMLNKDIAKCFQTSLSTINRRLADLGVVSRHPSLSKERINKAIELYMKYQNYARVAKEFNISEATVKQIVLQNNLPVRSMSEIKMSHNYNAHYFDVIDSNNKAYFLGLFGSDGNVGSNSNVINIALQEEDGYMIERFKQEIGYCGKTAFRERNSKNPNWKNQYYLTIQNKYLHDALIAQGVVPRKSYCYEFPNLLNPKYYSHYLRGMFDGDGSILKTECRASIVATPMFCESLQALLKQILGIHCSISLSHGDVNSPVRLLRIAGRNQVKKFLDWLYQDAEIYLERKYKIYQEMYVDQ